MWTALACCAGWCLAAVALGLALGPVLRRLTRPPEDVT